MYLVSVDPMEETFNPIFEIANIYRKPDHSINRLKDKKGLADVCLQTES